MKTQDRTGRTYTQSVKENQQDIPSFIHYVSKAQQHGNNRLTYVFRVIFSFRSDGPKTLQLIYRCKVTQGSHMNDVSPLTQGYYGDGHTYHAELAADRSDAWWRQEGVRSFASDAPVIEDVISTLGGGTVARTAVQSVFTQRPRQCRTTQRRPSVTTIRPVVHAWSVV